MPSKTHSVLQIEPINFNKYKKKNINDENQVMGLGKGNKNTSSSKQDLELISQNLLELHITQKDSGM